jgi:hypothetical protein
MFSHSRRQPHCSLSIECLEPRQMMSAVPALSSLPGADKTIFLDFDGDYQAEWHRTDKGQTYDDVFAQPANLSDEAVQKIWETVAEDFAPFNVNVTTVEPPSFANGDAMRVVIAGEIGAELVANDGSIIPIKGDRFITDNGVDLVDTSGYSAINSFNNDEPNVVYVFGEYLKTWSRTSPEGHSRPLAMLIANTASHEAGHSFGLVHDTGLDVNGDPTEYDVGGPVTTPIMGDNSAGDRTLWSQYTSGSTHYDAIQILTSNLGARPDDHPGGTWFAAPLTFVGNSVARNTSRAAVSGVVETTSDQDWFKFSTSGASFTFDLQTVEFANLDAKLEIYKSVPTFFGSKASLIASIDGPTLFGAPFSNLGATYSVNLAAGDYLVAVKSHGGYDDLGNYTLVVTQTTPGFTHGVLGTTGTNVLYLTAPVSTTSTSTTTTGATTLATRTAGGSGQSTSSADGSSAADAFYAQLGGPIQATPRIVAPPIKAVEPDKSYVADFDAVFARTTSFAPMFWRLVA